MLRRLYFFFCGYLRLQITDCRLETVINQLIKQGIELWAVDRINNTYYLNVRLEDFEKVKAVIEKKGGRLEVDRQKGIPFLTDKLIKRRGLIIGFILILILVFILPKFVLIIEIKGTETIQPAEIKNILAEYKIKPGVLKSSIPLSDLRKILIQEQEKLSWVNLYFQGVKLIVEVEEKEIIEIMKSCDVVADKAGIITELIVLKGRPVVEEGKTVQQGELLISRQVSVNKDDSEPNDNEEEDSQNSDKKYKQVKAAGIVKARVWYTGYGEAQLIKRHQQKTGNSQTSLIIKYKNKETVVTGPRKPPYADFKVKEQVKTLPEWRNYSLPVEIITRRYIQLKELKEKRSFQQAKKLAKRKAMDNILQQLSKKSIILNSQFKLIKISENQKLIRVKALVEVKEDIAIRRE